MQSEDDDDVISSTPALVPSKLAQENQVEKTPQEDKQPPVETSACEGKETNREADEVTANCSTSREAEETAIADLTSEQKEQADVLQGGHNTARNGLECQQSCLVASVSLSQSFLSFLQEDEPSDVTSNSSKPKVKIISQTCSEQGRSSKIIEIVIKVMRSRNSHTLPNFPQIWCEDSFRAS